MAEVATARVGRVWMLDAQEAGAYYLAFDGVLMHVARLQDDSFEWDNPGEVDFDRIDEDVAAEARVAEARLLAWGRAKGRVQRRGRHEAETDALAAEYGSWMGGEGLVLGSADDHLHDESLTVLQREWLADFVERWDARSE